MAHPFLFLELIMEAFGFFLSKMSHNDLINFINLFTNQLHCLSIIMPSACFTVLILTFEFSQRQQLSPPSPPHSSPPLPSLTGSHYGLDHTVQNF